MSSKRPAMLTISADGYIIMLTSISRDILLIFLASGANGFTSHVPSWSQDQVACCRPSSHHSMTPRGSLVVMQRQRLDERQTCRYTLVSQAASQSGIARMLVSTDPEQKFADIFGITS